MAPHARRGARWLKAVSMMSAVLVLSVLISERWLADRTWVTALVNYAPQLGWVVLPTVVLAWSALAWHARTFLFNLGVCLIAVFGIAGFEVPARLPTRQSADTVRIATWNILGCTGRTHAISEKMLRWDCDVACVQEAAPQRFRNLLPEEYAHASVSDLRTFVRGEILDTEVVATGHEQLQRALACDIRVGGERLKILNVHLSTLKGRRSLLRRERSLRDYMTDSVRVRQAQFDPILAWLPDEAPVVILGDFNTPPNSIFYRRMRGRLTDSFASVGLGFGYTFLLRGWPVFRIDYIWAGNGVQPKACWTDEAWPSDHRPVIVEVRPQCSGRR